METRLVQLLQSEGINPTRFAERIGVQRSSISHILSGRNKPSYDFIIKILESFPSVNPDWLLRGKGLMYKNDIPQQPSLFDAVKPVENKVLDLVEKQEGEQKHPIEQEQDKISEPVKVSEPIQNQTDKIKLTRLDNKTIEKVVIFYSDKTFSDYHPTL